MQNIHIATTIKALCTEKGITISTLLTDCGLTKSFIYDLEKRATSPSCDKISRIADYLDCPVDYLLGREAPAAPLESQECAELLHCYNLLSAEGKNKVVEYARDLSENSKYTEKGQGDNFGVGFAG